ncbi:IclR family transcriptional regulator [Kaistia algarum]|uniref:IclR family transcriptional regulator n=1 Tax=Kaistia algarum TaxID=2083279 RepID=UPI000CE886AD|nr:IclR family transcriptional regulator [Kaistia algarum]MCX5512818.1 IclR family transcriptional regulator [Kaistia algarum]PPE81688.1 IclR family transcriptional regulator [Kaistia algarum]
MTELTQKPADRPAYSAPALTKGLDVLELLAANNEPMTLKAIAEGLSRSKNEIFRMVMALQERDYIERDPVTDGYQLTDRLFKLGLHTPRVRDLVAVALPEMADLAEQIGQSPHLVVVHNGFTVVTAVVPGGADMSFTLKLGYQRLAVDATSGNVIIAHQSRPVRDRMVAESLAHAKVPIDPAELDARLDAIAARGYDMHDSRDFVGITDICCPVVGIDNQAAASIIISYVNRHNRENRQDAALRTLKAACRRISFRLSAGIHSEA